MLQVIVCTEAPVTSSVSPGMPSTLNHALGRATRVRMKELQSKLYIPKSHVRSTLMSSTCPRVQNARRNLARAGSAPQNTHGTVAREQLREAEAHVTDPEVRSTSENANL